MVDKRHNEAGAHRAAADNFHKNYKTLISAPRQAIEGLKPWVGCPRVTNVRLALAKLPALDGHEETDVNRRKVPFAPLLGGTTVLVAQTGGMKTVRTLDFFSTLELLEPVVPELEARVEWAQCTWVTLMSKERFSVVHQSAGKPTRPFFVAIATS